MVTEELEQFFIIIDQYLDLLADTLISMHIMKQAHLLYTPSSWIDDVFRNSLAYIQAKREKIISEEKLIKVLQAKNHGVIKLVGDKDKWTSIASSSIPVRASIEIDKISQEELPLYV